MPRNNMTRTEAFPLYVYECPFCNKIHHCTQDNPEQLGIWTEKCPETEEPIRLIIDT